MKIKLSKIDRTKNSKQLQFVNDYNLNYKKFQLSKRNLSRILKDLNILKKKKPKY